jgi:putative flippase GtrA
MWLLPAALCYAMQAGSISNDTLAGIYFLSAIYFAFEARRSGNVRHLWMGFLATGLLTGVKASNLPLLLPVVWAMWPALKLVEKRFASSVVVVALSLLVSFLPMAGLNQHYTGSWTGDPNNGEKMAIQKPLAGILGNGLQLGLQSLEPPFLPLARSVENWVWDRFPERLRTVLRSDFPRFGVGFRELPQEESAGAGIGITVIALVSLGAAWHFRRRNRMSLIRLARRHGLMVGLLTWIALLVYMSKMGSESTSRLIAAYYPFLLLPILLNPGQNFLVRQGWYRMLAACASTIALMAVFLTPSRPLWPAERFFDLATRRFPENELITHARMVYTVYRHRGDLFASLRESIPKSVPVIGLIEGTDDAESSLWRPFGVRRVVHVWEDRRGPDMNLHWLVVKNDVIEQGHAEDFDEWLQRGGGTVISQHLVTEKASQGPETWSVVHFPEAAQ